MLTPDHGQIVLLPQDLELIRLLGITPAEYKRFVRECQKGSRLRPGEPTAFLIIPFLIQLVIGIGLSLLASVLFRPRATSPRPARLEQRTIDGQDIVSSSRFAPKSGFDGLQNVVELGSIVPLVYAKRETIDGVTYGGVRVNTNLLWSQLYSLGGSQMLRGVFLIGEGGELSIDPAQFAFGDNLINGYDLNSADNTTGRISIYVSPEGGRITSSDHVAGRLPQYDDGNSENSGGPDVYSIPGVNGRWTTDFCHVSKPSTQTQFGLYSPLGNGLGFHVNPQVRPIVNAQLRPEGDKGDARVVCTLDSQSQASRNKQNAVYSCRSGFVAHNGAEVSGLRSVSAGDLLTYALLPSSDAGLKWTVVAEGPDAEEGCADVAQSVSGRQRSWDDAIVVGDMYRIGDALTVCVSRQPDDAVFISDVDNFPIGGGIGITATFKVVEGGRLIFAGRAQIQAAGNSGRLQNNGTNTSHLFKVAIATFVTTRPTQIVEIGLRSTVGLRFSGLLNFRECHSFADIDGKACRDFENNLISKGNLVITQNYQSGSYTGPEQRYSFFRLGYRVAGTDDQFTTLPQVFGVRSLTQQPVYNYLRLQMPGIQRWEYRLTPVSGWEIRNNIAMGSLEVLDSKVAGLRTIYSEEVTINYTGTTVERSIGTFRLPPTCSPVQIGIPKMDSESYVDDWGKLAEVFCFEEISASTDNPEHEVVYVNAITPNTSVPNYDGLAIVGVNVRSNTEFNQLYQLSIYVSTGLKQTHLFPEVLYDLMTNRLYGAGEILSPLQIDKESFDTAAQWTRDRRYFFDGAISERVNLRSWGAQQAAYFLLDLLVRNGRFALQPTVLFDKPEPITGLFTSGNILEDTFQLSYSDQQERQPPRISIKWREEKQSGDQAKRGLFPVLREVTVREAGTPADAPLEQVDLSDFCTSELHAIDYAKLVCRIRRLVTHTVKFKTTPDQAALDLGKTFKLGMEALAYEQPNNGVIAADGTVVSIRPIPDGTHPVMLWDGDTNEIQEIDLAISSGRNERYAGSVFCLRDATLVTQTYKVQSLAFDEDGNLDVEATHFPTDEKGMSTLVRGWNVESNWVIEGRIGVSDVPEELTQEFSNVSILGPSSVWVKADTEYSALISGPSGQYAYEWTAVNGTVSTLGASTATVRFDSPGVTKLTVSVTLDGTTITSTRTITVVQQPAAPLSLS
jgi:hypothetical protein